MYVTARIMTKLPNVLKYYEQMSRETYTYFTLQKLNPFIRKNDADGDILYHISLGTRSHDLPKMFQDIKVKVLNLYQQNFFPNLLRIEHDEKFTRPFSLNRYYCTRQFRISQLLGYNNKLLIFVERFHTYLHTCW